MSDSTQDAPLSELCNICHVNPPKYRCPRCSIRTCCLQCIQKHKKRSGCTGVRDPAAYLRRNELMTPAALDRDFNFITSIERGLERAEREADHRGIALEHDYMRPMSSKGGAGEKRKAPMNNMVKGEAAFLRAAKNAGVDLRRAPRGMTRNKQNTSRWHPKHKCLVWAVEWITLSGERLIRTCLETITLTHAYDQAFPRLKEEKQPSSAANEHLASSEPAQPVAQESSTTAAEDSSSAERSSAETGQKIQEDPSNKGPPTDSSSSDGPSSSPQSIEAPHPHRDVYFYLHRPHTGTKQTVLIPVSPSSPLRDILRGRTVSEFPTIYILPQSPQELSQSGHEKFLLEEEYLAHASPTGDGPDKADDSRSEDGEKDGLDNLVNIDENKVLEVLKKDLAAAS